MQAKSKFESSVVQALLLAAAAVEATGPGEPPEPAAEQVLRDLLAQVGGYPLRAAADGGPRESHTVSRDGRWLLSGDSGKPPLLWDMMAPSPPNSMTAFASDSLYPHFAGFDPTGRWLFLAWRSAKLQSGRCFFVDLRRDPATRRPVEVPSVEGRGVTLVDFSPDGAWLLLRFTSSPPHLYKLGGDGSVPVVQEVALEIPGRIATDSIEFQFGPGSSWLAGRSLSDSLLWDLRPDRPSGTPRVLKLSAKPAGRAASSNSARTAGGSPTCPPSVPKAPPVCGT